MPPSVVVSFVEEVTCDGLSEGETMLLSKFDYAAHGFLPFRLASCDWRCLDGRFLSEGKEVRLQRHTAGMSARKETGFDLGPQVKGDGHGNLSFQFTPGRRAVNLNPFLPTVLKKISVIFYLKNLCPVEIPIPPPFNVMVIDPTRRRFGSPYPGCSRCR
jgi:hypothetical protein